jgi:hypothetical protein
VTGFGCRLGALSEIEQGRIIPASEIVVNKKRRGAGVFDRRRFTAETQKKIHRRDAEGAEETQREK